MMNNNTLIRQIFQNTLIPLCCIYIYNRVRHRFNNTTKQQTNYDIADYILCLKHTIINGDILICKQLCFLHPLFENMTHTLESHTALVTNKAYRIIM